MNRARLQLPDVTLVAVDTVAHALTAMAVRKCLDQVDFGATIVFSDRRLDVPGAEWIKCGPFASIDGADHTLWYDVPQYVRTSHLLVIQWDSWIVNPALWCDEYLRYDYIGAPWWWHRDGMNVGNGGFSLRSARLARLLVQQRQTMPCGSPEDDALCRRYRRELERHGICFAPDLLAACFSSERSWPPFVSFGFHGMFNWPRVLSSAEIEARLAVAPPYVLTSLHCAQMRELMRAEKAGAAA